jgi:hypothetical protein
VRRPDAERDPVEPVPRRGSVVGALAAGVGAIVVSQVTMVAWGIGTASLGNLDLIHGVRGPRIVGISVLVHALLTGLVGNRIRKRESGARAAFGIGLLIGAGLEVLVAGPCAIGGV